MIKNYLKSESKIILIMLSTFNYFASNIKFDDKFISETENCYSEISNIDNYPTSSLNYSKGCMMIQKRKYLLSLITSKIISHSHSHQKRTKQIANLK